METNSCRPVGFLDSFRILGDGLLALAHDRAELFTIELQEEKFRLIQISIWIGAAMFTGFMACTFASVLLVYVFWASARLTVLGGLTAIYTIAFVAILLALRRLVTQAPKPFAATVQALRADRECTRNAN